MFGKFAIDKSCGFSQWLFFFKKYCKREWQDDEWTGMIKKPYLASGPALVNYTAPTSANSVTEG